MRIIKLSPVDEEMTTRDDVIHYFSHELWKKSRFGKFGLTPDKAQMRGIERGTLLLFSYETECMFLARAAGAIVETDDAAFPAYLPLSMGSLAPVTGSLGEFEAALRRADLIDKNLVHAQAWPSLSPESERFADRYFKYSDALRYVFVRVGWMQHYRGSAPGDERPIGGGGYNRDEVGHEICNFLPLDGALYGYFQPQMRADQTFLERIDRHARDQEDVSKVTVIWVATRPMRGQQIIGWYRNARVYRGLGPAVAGRPDGFEQYRCTSRVRDGVLLPVTARDFSIPRGKGAFGQANVCYPLNSDGSRKEAQWMFHALCYLAGYEGGNVVADPAEEALDAVVKELEAARDGRSGQGFNADAAERTVLEQYGMAAATRYFEKQGFDVDDVSKRKPYDLRCTKGNLELRVEVKATTTAGESVFLTRREAEHATEANLNRALFILHSIRLRDGIPTGGQRMVHHPWAMD